MARFAASVEVGRDHWCTIWVPGLPGLFVNESSERAALRRLPAAIAAYADWLARHGEPAPAPRTVRVAIAERYVVPVRLRWGEYYALHAFERPPVTEAEVTACMRRMGDLRAETVRLIESLPRGALRWTRPGQTRTIREHLYHLARAERWYLGQLGLYPRVLIKRTRNPVERLARMRAVVAWRLLRLTPQDRAKVVEADGRWWSVRKMLGRFLYHERYHLRSIARIARCHRFPAPDGLAGWERY